MLEIPRVQEAMLAQDCIAEKLTGLRGEKRKNPSLLIYKSECELLCGGHVWSTLALICAHTKHLQSFLIRISSSPVRQWPPCPGLAWCAQVWYV